MIKQVDFQRRVYALTGQSKKHCVKTTQACVFRNTRLVSYMNNTR